MTKTKLVTVKKAKEEIKRLQEYIDLVESYHADTLERLIIKEYALSNSIAEVLRVLEHRHILKNGKPVEKQDALDVIKSKPQDKLHRLVKSAYMAKTKHSRSVTPFK